jgi:hypothetical protein
MAAAVTAGYGPRMASRVRSISRTGSRGDHQLNGTVRCDLIPGGRSLTEHHARRHVVRAAVLDGDLRVGDNCADDCLRLDQVHASDRGHARLAPLHDSHGKRELVDLAFASAKRFAHPPDGSVNWRRGTLAGT